MSENKGWIKIYRELFDKSIWQLSTKEQKVILITLLSMANHKPKKWEWQGKQFECEAGQFITSISKIAEKSGKDISHRNVRTALERFEKLEFLTNESTKTGRLITIVNWEHYQGCYDEGDKDTDKEPTKSRQRHDKEPTTNKNDKELKNNNIVSKDTNCQTDVRQVVDAWNSLAECGVKTVLKLGCTSKRYQMLVARIKEYGVDDVLKAVENVKHSRYLQGKVKEWAITFDWFVKPNNFPKVLEGNYDDKDRQEENQGSSQYTGRQWQ